MLLLGALLLLLLIKYRMIDDGHPHDEGLAITKQEI
jgi:hypothetical protein